jgi:hypothetical protein
LELLSREYEELVDVPFGRLGPRRVPFSNLPVATASVRKSVERHAHSDEAAMRLGIPPCLLDLAPCLVDGIHETPE